jgi:hypothetical protein
MRGGFFCGDSLSADLCCADFSCAESFLARGAALICPEDERTAEGARPGRSHRRIGRAACFNNEKQQEHAMSEPLVTELGRYDRAAIVARAQEIYRGGAPGWGAAMSAAYREASEELAARQAPPPLSVRAVRSAA